MSKVKTQAHENKSIKFHQNPKGSISNSKHVKSNKDIKQILWDGQNLTSNQMIQFF